MSAYQGWLLKIGDYVIDQSRFIAAESYQPAVNMQDVYKRQLMQMDTYIEMLWS